MDWTVDILMTGLGAALALVFGLFPPAQRWFDAHLTTDTKPLFMAGSLLLLTVARLLFGNVTSWPAWGLPVFQRVRRFNRAQVRALVCAKSRQ